MLLDPEKGFPSTSNTGTVPNGIFALYYIINYSHFIGRSLICINIEGMREREKGQRRKLSGLTTSRTEYPVHLHAFRLGFIEYTKTNKIIIKVYVFGPFSADEADVFEGDAGDGEDNARRFAVPVDRLLKVQVAQLRQCSRCHRH